MGCNGVGNGHMYNARANSTERLGQAVRAARAVDVWDGRWHHGFPRCNQLGLQLGEIDPHVDRLLDRFLLIV